jgi:ubiquinone biosynthesis monooxygenase Coq7
LSDQDAKVSATIIQIQREELEHLHFAETHGGLARELGWARGLDGLVVAATNALIWLSTYGASSRMTKQMAG